MEFGSFMEFHTRPSSPQANAFAEGLNHVDMGERLGLDGVWMAETHFNPERSILSSPIITAAALAGRTKRIKIGTAVYVLPLNNPLRIAEEVSTLDHLSNGRFQFGIGRSGLPGSYQGYNIPYGQSRDMFSECLEVIRQAWTNDSFSFSGDYYSYSDVCLTPKPLTKPHPQIRIAVTSAQSFPRTGEMGYPIFIGVRQIGVPQVAEQVRSYVDGWKAAGHEGQPDVFLRIPTYVAETRDAALSEPEESFMLQFQRLGRQLAAAAATTSGADPTGERSRASQQLADITWDRVIPEKVIVGTPEMVVDRVHELKEELMLTGIIAEFNAGEQLSREQIDRSLRLLCEKVMPHFK